MFGHNYYDSVAHEYGAYALSSVFMTSLLFNIFLVCRINYSDICITKMTIKPYLVSLLYLAAMSIQSCCVAVIAQYQGQSE